MNHVVDHLETVKRVTKLKRQLSQADTAEVLADIYRDDVNISVWKRTLSPELAEAAHKLLQSKKVFRISTSVTPEDTYSSLYDSLGANSAADHLCCDIAEIVAMFCCLFELQRVGLRLTSLDRAMCPKFHVDRVPCRLVTTYGGIATQWLPHQTVDRSKLGTGSKGATDEESGLYRGRGDIQQLLAGDVALLKGESWLGNEGGGLVHRSPSLKKGATRLLLTLDFN